MIYYKGLGIRIGAGGTQIQSIVPPSRNADGSRRTWDVSFRDCVAAPLPEVVVDRILASSPYVTLFEPLAHERPSASAFEGLREFESLSVTL